MRWTNLFDSATTMVMDRYKHLREYHLVAKVGLETDSFLVCRHAGLGTERIVS